MDWKERIGVMLTAIAMLFGLFWAFDARVESILQIVAAGFNQIDGRIARIVELVLDFSDRLKQLECNVHGLPDCGASPDR